MNASAKTRVLFVDDELQILKLLELMLKPMEDEWEMAFVDSGRKALEFMEKQPCQILITDMRMPSMTGVELLNEVMRLYPYTVRVILSAYADQEMVLRAIGATHMYLSKPVALEELKSTLQRIRGLNSRLRSGKIRELVSKVITLPSIPSVYFQIMNALQSPSVTSAEIGEIVATDPGLSAKFCNCRIRRFSVPLRVSPIRRRRYNFSGWELSALWP